MPSSKWQVYYKHKHGIYLGYIINNKQFNETLLFYYCLIIKHVWILFTNITTILHFSIADPPSFLEVPDPTTIVAERQTVNITCRANGAPNPEMLWSRVESDREIPLTGGKFTIHKSGYLTIAVRLIVQISFHIAIIEKRQLCYRHHNIHACIQYEEITEIGKYSEHTIKHWKISEKPGNLKIWRISEIFIIIGLA